MSSANSENFANSFPIWTNFISFSSLVTVGRISKTMLNSSCESGYPCLVPDFGRNALNFLPLKICSHGFYILIGKKPVEKF